MKKSSRPSIAKYLKRHAWGCVLYVLTISLSSGFQIFQTLGLAKGIELITYDDYMGTIYAFLFAGGAFLLQMLFHYLNDMLFFKLTSRIVSELNLDLAKQAFSLNSKTFNDHDTGTFVQRIVTDPERLVEGMAGVVDVFSELLMSVIMLIYIMTLNVYVALLGIFAIAIGLAIESWRVRVRRKNRKIMRKKNDKINSLTTEIVRSEKDIKSLGLENKLSEVSRQNYDEYRTSRERFGITDSRFWTARNIFANFGSLAVLILGVHLMRVDLITLGTFMIIYSNNRISNFVWQFGQVSNQIVDMKVAHDRMFSLFDQNEFVTETFGERDVKKVKGKIEFRKVSFSYREYDYKFDKQTKLTSKTLTSENKIFDKLSFVVKPNTTVAFVGKSGSGKSTILNLISKMYVADSGKVLIDGVDVNDFSKTSLRSTISLVNQFPYIFDMTIKENLLLAKADATDEEIVDSLKQASLYDEFVKGLPNNINTRVGESGIKLSGGQKQRLAIARALLRKSSIIIFDESTSSLDNFAQNSIKRTIDSLKGKSTIVIVAHRLSTIKDVDEIFFLDEGKIVDRGTFDELFERNEKFRAMFLVENI